MNYNLLKNSLNFETAISWLAKDSSDDFFPDPINWNDIKKFPSEYLEKRQHRLFQFESLPCIMEYMPKKSGMLREAVWLHPVLRILYLAILRKFLSRLDAKIYPEIYSYRLDNSDDLDAYPFSNKMDRWKLFHNDFRETALNSETGAVLITDLASFFDHINCEQVGHRIQNILANTMDQSDEEVINLLTRLLKMWGNDNCGMPHNLDASSFFGSIYLHPVDHDMITQRFRYFRWIDDIRVAAKNREQALRALHQLQRSLAKYHLYLATDKTTIIERSDSRYDELLNVEDDILISEAEEVISSGDKLKIEEMINTLFERLEYHASVNGDDRKFRAIANRIMDAGDYIEIETDIHDRLNKFVIPRFNTHPERSDYWMKMLSVRVNDDTTKMLEELLVDRPSLFDWQRFYLWKLALYLNQQHITDKLLDKARSVAVSPLSENVASQAIIFLGKHGDNVERESLYARLFTPQKGYIIQRAIIIAIQELPTGTKKHYYQRALEINSDHKELIEYLSNRDIPDYGLKIRNRRHVKPEPKQPINVIRRGVGIAKGKVIQFRLSYNDYDY